MGYNESAKGDIECYEEQNGILVEVTMSTGRTQTMMEIWPIERHLIEFQKERTAQCLFVAPSIYNDSLRQIQFVCSDSKGVRVIRPYAIKEFLDYIEKTNNLYAQGYESVVGNVAADSRPLSYGKK